MLLKQPQLPEQSLATEPVAPLAFITEEIAVLPFAPCGITGLAWYDSAACLHDDHTPAVTDATRNRVAVVVACAGRFATCAFAEPASQSGCGYVLIGLVGRCCSVLRLNIGPSHPSGRWFPLDHPRNACADCCTQIAGGGPLPAELPTNKLREDRQPHLSLLCLFRSRHGKRGAILVNEAHDGLPAFRSVLIFLLSVANSVIGNRPIPTPDNDDIVVAIVDHLAYQCPLVFICRWKQLHSSRYTVKFQQCLHHLLSLFSQILIGRAYENLVSFVHSPSRCYFLAPHPFPALRPPLSVLRSPNTFLKNSPV